MNDTLFQPKKLIPINSTISINPTFHIASFTNQTHIRNKSIINLITNELKAVIIDQYYLSTHVLFLENYFDSQNHNRRRPSTFIIYDLIKFKRQTWYNNNVYESYTEEVDKIFNFTELLRDEYSDNKPLFSKVIDQIKDVLAEGNKHYNITPYVEILKDISLPNNWEYYNAEDMEVNLVYTIIYKGKSYYISYNLIGIYYYIGDIKDPKLSTTIIDPLLRVLQTSHPSFYKTTNKLKLKLGLYYVDVTTYLPKVEHQNNGILTNLTYKYYKSKINYTPSPNRVKYTLLSLMNGTAKNIGVFLEQRIEIMETHEEHQIYLPTTQITIFSKCYNDRLKYFSYKTLRGSRYTQPKIYDNIYECVGIIENIKIIHTHYKKYKSTLILKNSYGERIIKNGLLFSINISPQLKILNITFTKYVKLAEHTHIRSMLNDCYITNIKLQNYMKSYKSIKIIKGLHTDMNRLEKSLHFNCVFLDTDNEESSVFHLYISNDKITTITTIMNIL